MILKNKLGLEGKVTQPVNLVSSFINSLFNIEKDYGNGETFTIITNGEKREHLKNHLTNADFQLATILLKCCNGIGQINDTTPHGIYLMIAKYFEKPICLSQFYVSLRKFVLQEIVEERYNEHTKTTNYKLVNYINAETKKMDFYVPLSPIVFTEKFTELSLPKKKLFYSIYLQQGGIEGKEIERKMISEKESVQFSGLYNFLHRQDPYLIRKMIEEMCEPFVDGKALLAKGELVKQGKAYHKAIISIHANWIARKTEGVELQEHIPIPMIYRRKANFIQRLLEEWGIGEFYSLEKGRSFSHLVRLLKNYGFRMIRSAVYQLKKFHEEYHRFPVDIIQFILKEVRLRAHSMILDIAIKTKVVDYIAPLEESSKRKDREFEFSSNISYHGPKLIEKMCKAALPLLKQKYGRPAQEHLSLHNYRIDPTLDMIHGFELVRMTAYRQLIDVRAYTLFEQDVAGRYLKEKTLGALDERAFINSALDSLHRLPTIDIVPIIPLGFKLEDFLVQNFIPQML